MSYFAAWSPFLFLSLCVWCSWESQSLKTVLTRLPSPLAMQIKHTVCFTQTVQTQWCKELQSPACNVHSLYIFHYLLCSLVHLSLVFSPLGLMRLFFFFFFGYAVSVLCVYSVPSISWRQSCILLPLQFQTWPRLRHRLAVSSPTRCWCARSWGSLLCPPTLCSALWDAHSVDFCLL